MKKRSTIALIALLAMLFTLVTVSGIAAAPKKIVMKISHVSAPGSARDIGSYKVKEVVEKMTNGLVTAQVYPSSQLGGQRDQVEGVQFGTIEMVVVPTSYLGGIQPLITLLDTPFLLPEDPQTLYKLYQSDAIKQLLDTTKEKGIITLAIWQTGYKQYTANKPLFSPTEMKGLKVRVMNSPILFEQAKVLGANPITMDFGETYGALQNKAIDGQENPIDTIYDMKFHEVQTDITLTNHSTLDQLVMVNKKWFEGLDKEVQDAIVEGVRQAGIACLEATNALIKKDTDIILATGKTKIHSLTKAQRDAWKKALEPVQKFARTSQGERGAKLFDLIVAEAAKLEK
jgi:C4-dicarboxylate-binding protein DctP